MTLFCGKRCIFLNYFDDFFITLESSVVIFSKTIEFRIISVCDGRWAEKHPLLSFSIRSWFFESQISNNWGRVAWSGPRTVFFQNDVIIFFGENINRITSAKFFCPVRKIHREILRINYFFLHSCYDWHSTNLTQNELCYSFTDVKLQCTSCVSKTITFSGQALIFLVIIFVGNIKLPHEYTTRKPCCCSIIC